MTASLNNCPDCRGIVSASAESCPHCGRVFVPTKKPHSVLYYVLAVLFWLFVISIAFPVLMLMFGLAAGNFFEARTNARQRAKEAARATNAQEVIVPPSDIETVHSPSPEEVQAQRIAQEEERAQLSKAKVLKYHLDLAEKHDPYGELCMARRYATGDGVEKNLATAKVYFIRAATHGSTEAEAELGKLTTNP